MHARCLLPHQGKEEPDKTNRSDWTDGYERSALDPVPVHARRPLIALNPTGDEIACAPLLYPLNK